MANKVKTVLDRTVVKTITLRMSDIDIINNEDKFNFSDFCRWGVKNKLKEYLNHMNDIKRDDKNDDVEN